MSVETRKNHHCLYKALQTLSEDGIGRDNLYKFFLPSKIKETINQLGLQCTETELLEEWRRCKDFL